MSNDLPPAGWYPNPDGTGGLRWWSGIGWSEYTRTGPPTVTDAAVQPPATGTVEQPLAPDPTVAQPVQPPASAWDAGAGAPAATAPLGGYAPYSPPPSNPLTGSGMRPLGSMFSDIGRIVRRAWWPILAISVIIWTAMTALMAVLGVALVDLPAFRRGLDFLGTTLDSTPDGNLSQAQIDQLQADFGQAFSRLPVAGWVLIGVILSVLLLLASTVQIGAVNRLAMDATTSNPVSWGPAWRSGFTAGLRLFGYYVLITVLAGVALVLVVGAIALAAQLSPALAVALGLLAFIGSIVLSVWLTGRLIPTLAQVVVAGGALRWSWRATKGKYWAVLGRYLLWSLAASVIINVVLTVISIPVSLLFLGSSTSADPFSQLGLALSLNLILLPLSMATAAITIVGIVPIWRDLTDHPVYRSIDDEGLPITQPGA